LKIYYDIPDSDSDVQNKMMHLLYENMRLKILLAVADIKGVVEKENGTLFIERAPGGEELQFRFEGFSPAMELVIRGCISSINKKKELKF
jgi:hypothetical protein